MLVLAHRGCHVDAPENTLEAFAAASRLGVDGIETDVRVSRDGFPVLVHDRVLVGRPVSALTRGEIEHRLGHSVPTLDEALLALPDLYWNIEIKTRDAIAPTLATLARHEGARCLVTSFRHDVVAAIAAQVDVECGLLMAERPLSLKGWLDPAQPLESVRTIVCDFEVLDGGLVDTAHSEGWRLFAYGVEAREEHAACAAMGVDGVITDHPEFGLEVR
jgi:glycerophosphoryl diester phosphodiesterase